MEFRRKWVDTITGSVTTAARRGVMWGAKSGLMAGGASLASGAASTFYYKYWEQPVYKQRIGEDDINFMRDNSLKEYNRKQNYEFKKSENIINLNRLTNTYIKPTINDDDIQRAMNKSNE